MRTVAFSVAFQSKLIQRFCKVVVQPRQLRFAIVDTKPKSEDEIDEAISDNYEEDFEDASAGQSAKKVDDFFKDDKKNIEKQSEPSQNSGLPFNDPIRCLEILEKIRETD